MRFQLELVIRIAGSDTFMPIEKAQAVSYENRESAVHKDGGYYVFVRPLSEGAVISINAAGYEPEEIKFNGERMITIYLKSRINPPQSVKFFAAALTKKGELKIKAAFVDGSVPAVLEGCCVKRGGSQYIIKSYDRLSAEIVVDKPLIRDIHRGDAMEIFVE